MLVKCAKLINFSAVIVYGYVLIKATYLSGNLHILLFESIESETHHTALNFYALLSSHEVYKAYE